MNFIHTVNDKTNNEVDVSDLMIEQEVKFGPKTGLEAVQNGEHAVVGLAASDDKTKPSRPRDMATMTGQACHHLFHTKCYIQ